MGFDALVILLFTNEIFNFVFGPKIFSSANWKWQKRDVEHLLTTLLMQSQIKWKLEIYHKQTSISGLVNQYRHYRDKWRKQISIFFQLSVKGPRKYSNYSGPSPLKVVGEVAEIRQSLLRDFQFLNQTCLMVQTFSFLAKQVATKDKKIKTKLKTVVRVVT